jgi:hypothetical protein
MQKFKNQGALLVVLSVFLVIISFTGCDIINPSEKIPAYIHIDSFDLKGNYDSNGTLSHSITDVWVVVDNDFIGAFELPADIPVLKEGSHKILLKAGIKENGISNTRLPYPFYAPYIATFDLKPNVTDTIRPLIYYNEGGYKMAFNEDYENPNYAFIKSLNSTITPEITNLNGFVFEGDNSLIARLTKKNDLFQIETVQLFQMPRAHAIFMEINYKSDISLKVGYYAVSSSQTYQHLVLTLNPAKTWKKIYVNMGGEIDYEPKQYFFRFFLGGIKYSENDTSVVQFDNIKLLYLE